VTSCVGSKLRHVKIMQNAPGKCHNLQGSSKHDLSFRSR